MDIYTYSEARQRLSLVLDKAEATGKVFALCPEAVPPRSPLDVPSIKADISTSELVALVRKSRGLARGYRRSHKAAATPRG